MKSQSVIEAILGEAVPHENEFTTEVDVEINGGAFSDDAEIFRVRTGVTFTIDLEYRNWGLKDVYRSVTKISPIVIEDGENQITIDVPLDKVDVASVDKVPVTFNALEVNLDKNNAVVDAELS